MRCHLTPVRMARIKTRNNKYWWRCREKGLFIFQRLTLLAWIWISQSLYCVNNLCWKLDIPLSIWLFSLLNKHTLTCLLLNQNEKQQELLPIENIFCLFLYSSALQFWGADLSYFPFLTPHLVLILCLPSGTHTHHQASCFCWSVVLGLPKLCSIHLTPSLKPPLASDPYYLTGTGMFLQSHKPDSKYFNSSLLCF